jgi:hypothetical protein
MEVIRQWRSTPLVLLGFILASAINLVCAQDAANSAVSVFELSFLDQPESLEFDEVTDQYFTHKGEGDNAGCLSVFTPDNVLIQEDFGCCPGAMGMVVSAIPPPPPPSPLQTS